MNSCETRIQRILVDELMCWVVRTEYLYGDDVSLEDIEYALRLQADVVKRMCEVIDAEDVLAQG